MVFRGGRKIGVDDAAGADVDHSGKLSNRAYRHQREPPRLGGRNAAMGGGLRAEAG
ncbi:hypothetical protein [Mesorhizobium sophorae]|uniref:hypothetical protein n=1 Tax=Mesorhizobium sophorae TaxID=1300294 RepID=UPI00142E7427|nr:hypothetical protein [Mesorhizobium sophorae]